jgi:hypothetical protein
MENSPYTLEKKYSLKLLLCKIPYKKDEKASYRLEENICRSNKVQVSRIYEELSKLNSLKTSHNKNSD